MAATVHESIILYMRNFLINYQIRVANLFDWYLERDKTYSNQLCQAIFFLEDPGSWLILKFILRTFSSIVAKNLFNNEMQHQLFLMKLS